MIVCVGGVGGGRSNLDLCKPDSRTGAGVGSKVRWIAKYIWRQVARPAAFSTHAATQKKQLWGTLVKNSTKKHDMWLDVTKKPEYATRGRLRRRGWPKLINGIAAHKLVAEDWSRGGNAMVGENGFFDTNIHVHIFIRKFLNPWSGQLRRRGHGIKTRNE